MTALIIGSSHVVRFRRYIATKGLETYNANLGLNISYFGIGGGCIGNAQHVRRLEREIRRVHPEFLIVMIGGNDFDSDNNEIECTVLRLTNLCGYFKRKYNIHRVFINQFLPRTATRHVPPHQYNERVLSANRYLKETLKEEQHISYWKLKGFFNCMDEVFVDGVHLNPAGMHKLYRHIRGALLQCRQAIGGI